MKNLEQSYAKLAINLRWHDR